MSDNQEVIVRPQTDIENTAQKRLLDVLGRYKKTLDAILPKIIDPKRFAWLAVSAIRENPRLAEVSPASFLNCVILASQMGIEIRRDSCYIIPFGKVAQLLIDYKAKLSVVRRGGKVGGIQAVTIREHDRFDWKYTIRGVEFNHEPFAQGILSPEERGQIVGVYGFAHLNDGGVQFRDPMSLAEIDRIRKRSRAGVSSMTLQEIFAAQELTPDGKQAIWQTWQYRDDRRQPWVTDFESMALKTVLHSLCKGLPLEPAAQLSQEIDAGYETGKQPNILADAVDIDPEDEQPMISASPEEQDRVLQEKLAQARDEQRAKKEAKKAKLVAREYDSLAGAPDPLEVEPGTKIYVQGVLYEQNGDRSAWSRTSGV